MAKVNQSKKDRRLIGGSEEKERHFFISKDRKQFPCWQNKLQLFIETQCLSLTSYRMLINTYFSSYS